MRAWIVPERRCFEKPGAGRRFVVVLFAALAMAGTAGFASAFGGYGIPVHPSAKTLSGRLKPDLAVEDLRVSWQSVRAPKHAIKGLVTARIRNIGRATSHVTPLACSVTAGGKVTGRKTFEIRALKPGGSTRITWQPRFLPGKNTIKLVLKDPHNRSNNTAQKNVSCARRIDLSHRGSPPPGTAGYRRLPPQPGKAPGRLKLAPDLAVSRITFNDFEARKPEESWVRVEISNVGTARSRPTSVLGMLRRADGSQERKVMHVAALDPGKTAVIQGPIRLSAGENTLTMQVRDRNNPGNNTLSRSHFFAPRRRGRLDAAKGRQAFFHPSRTAGPERAANRNPHARPGLPMEKRPAGAPVARAVGHRLPRVTKPGARLPGAAAQKPVPHDLQTAMFIHPRAGEVLAPGRPYTIAWGLSDYNPYSEFWLQLKTDIPHAPPILILARHMDPSARSISWNVSPELPMGTYQLALLSPVGPGQLLLPVAKTTFRIGHVRFHIVDKKVLPKPPGLPKVGKTVTVSARLVNSGAEATALTAGVSLYGPRGFHIDKRFSFDTLEHGDPGKLLAVTFVPPFYGVYRAVFEPDIDHRYPHGTDGVSEVEKTRHINVNPLPDLLLTINKVKDGILGENKHFHIRVKNIGQSTSPQTKVNFYLTHAGHHHYEVPALEPGQTWKLDFEKRWKWHTGDKTYWAEVDPDNQIEEINEGNNKVSDHLHIYRPGQPRPKQQFAPPRLKVIAVYGLRPAMTAGKQYILDVRFQNISPDRQDTPPPVAGDLDHDGSHRISYTSVIFGADNAWVTIPNGHESVQGVSLSSNAVTLPKLLPGETWDVAVPIIWGDTLPQGGDSATTTYPSSFWVSSEHFGWQYNKNEIPPWNFRKDSLQRIYSSRVTIRLPAPSAQAVSKALTGGKAPVLGHGKRLHILAPVRGSFWTRGRTVQIAWAGDVQPPYDIRLMPADHPGPPISLADGVSARSYNYTVAHNLAAGRYRVRVQGKGGWNASGKFEIRAGKPDLCVKAASISNGLSGDLAKPYRIVVKAVIENRGGYENKPFKVRFTISKASNARQAFRGVFAKIDAPPMLDRGTLPLEKTFAVPYADGYDIRVGVDPDHRVAESDETNNELHNRLYRVKALPDLHLLGHQTGRRMHFTVENQGDTISGGSNIFFTYAHQAGGQGKIQTRIICTPHILGLNPGNEAKVSCDIPTAARPGDPFSATINLHKSFREIRYDNNTVRGTLLSPENNPAQSGREVLSNFFQVVDKTSLSQNFTVADGRQHPAAHPHFRFVIANKNANETTLPVEAILVMRDGSEGVTRSFDVPRLYPASDHNDRHAASPSEFRINWPGTFPVGTNVSYTLSLRLGSATLQVASGVVQIGYRRAGSGQ